MITFSAPPPFSCLTTFKYFIISIIICQNQSHKENRQLKFNKSFHNFIQNYNQHFREEIIKNIPNREVCAPHGGIVNCQLLKIHYYIIVHICMTYVCVFIKPLYNKNRKGLCFQLKYIFKTTRISLSISQSCFHEWFYFFLFF